MTEEQALARVRALRAQQAKKEADQLARAAGWGADTAPGSKIRVDLAEQRRQALQEAWAVADPALADIAQRRRTMDALGIVDVLGNHPRERQPGAVATVVDAERRRRKEQPDPARLARLPKQELVRLANATTDVCELADVKNELLLRAEQQGDDDARSEAGLVGTQLARRVAELPDVRTRAAHDAHLATVAEHITLALKALEDGGEDLGERFESYARISDARARGDRRPVIMRPDGSLTFAPESDAS